MLLQFTFLQHPCMSLPAWTPDAQRRFTAEHGLGCFRKPLAHLLAIRRPGALVSAVPDWRCSCSPPASRCCKSRRPVHRLLGEPRGAVEPAHLCAQALTSRRQLSHLRSSDRCPLGRGLEQLPSRRGFRSAAAVPTASSSSSCSCRISRSPHAYCCWRAACTLPPARHSTRPPNRPIRTSHFTECCGTGTCDLGVPRRLCTVGAEVTSAVCLIITSPCRASATLDAGAAGALSSY